MKNRGQLFTWDLVFATFIFLVSLLLSIYLWESTTNDIVNAERTYDMEWLSTWSSEELVRIPGYPYNWTTADVVVYGLTHVARVLTPYGSEQKVVYTTPVDRVLDSDKMMFFVQSVNSDYESARRRFLGEAQYNFYVSFFCVNESRMDCFDGLPLRFVRDNVTCGNNYTFTQRDGMLDSRIWLEAEQWWGNPNDEKCGNCSAGNMSLNPSSAVVSLNAIPRLYSVWVRDYDDPADRSFQIKVGPDYSRVLGVHGSNEIRWEYVGDYYLDGSSQVSFNFTNSATLVDAVLITSDVEYNPASRNPPYGNPFMPSDPRCVVGQVPASGYDLLVSDTKTATFWHGSYYPGTPGSPSYFSNYTVRVQVVAWV
ncbi:Uncharacterised protein [uncultured archaeon]|nr:Uncharacterised protein [uncultured archaeon]